MCGITGIVHFDQSNQVTSSSDTPPINWEVLGHMTDTLAHRGPDGEGYLGYTPYPGSPSSLISHAKTWQALANQSPQAKIAFGHRRLAIQDLTEAGHQPMVYDMGEKGQFAITYNGEVYNYIELREELKKLGFSFTTQTDTEVVLKSYIAWGEGALIKFIGMFSFAILDTKKQILFLARDFFGIKPLYYYTNENLTKPKNKNKNKNNYNIFIFASEIKALLQHPDIQPEANPEAHFDYLTRGTCDFPDKTFYQHIYPLPAAHFLKINLNTDNTNTLIPIRYWDIDYRHTLDIGFTEAQTQLRNLLTQNISLHQRAQTPIAASLSGGIDSSILVSLLCHQLPSQRYTDLNHQMNTFSFIPENKNFSEEKWIDLLAARLPLQTHKIQSPELSNLANNNLYYQVLKTQDQPFGGASIIAQYILYQTVKKSGFKVLLGGQGADELFAGYHYFLAYPAKNLWQTGQYISSVNFIIRAIKYNQLFNYPSLVNIINWFKKNKNKNKNNNILNNNKFKISIDDFEKNNLSPSKPTSLRHALYLNLTRDKLPSLLRYEDHNSMAHSIESRLPFLTPALATFALQVPEHYLINQHGQTKALLRAAFTDIVPSEILQRCDKIGFKV